MYVLPTGAGKTVIVAELVRQLEAEQKRTLMLVHRDEIFRQTLEKLDAAGVRPMLIQAGARLGPASAADGGGEDDAASAAPPLTTLAMVQTVSRRLGFLQARRFDCVIIDEAHHVTAGSYAKVLDATDAACDIGITATPFRLDGKGLGEFFRKVVRGPTMSELIQQGHLVPLRYVTHTLISTEGVRVERGDYAVQQLSRNARFATEKVVQETLRHLERRDEAGALTLAQPTLVFGVDLEHARDLCAAFAREGVAAEHVDGATGADERKAMMERFARGELQMLTNCMIATEGFDAPSCGAVVLARPTKSRGLFLQMTGRGLRPAPAKAECLFLDFAGLVEAHGLPTDPLDFTLEDGLVRDEPGAKELSGGGVEPDSVQLFHESVDLVWTYMSVTLRRVSHGGGAEPPPEPGSARLQLSWVDRGERFSALLDTALELPSEPLLTVLVTWQSRAAEDGELAAAPDSAAHPSFNVALFSRRRAFLPKLGGGKGEAGRAPTPTAKAYALWVEALVTLLAEPGGSQVRDHFRNLVNIQTAKGYKPGWVWYQLVPRWGADTLEGMGYGYEEWLQADSASSRRRGGWGGNKERAVRVIRLPEQWGDAPGRQPKLRAGARSLRPRPSRGRGPAGRAHGQRPWHGC